jgi:quinol monooxygenase YgiN
VGVADHGVGDAPEQRPSQQTEAPAADDHDPGVQFLGKPHDLSVRAANPHMRARDLAHFAYVEWTGSGATKLGYGSRRRARWGNTWSFALRGYGTDREDAMIVECIRYSIPEDRRADFERAYAEASAVLDGSEHCLGYEVSRGVKEPDNYVVRIEWDSIEGHEQGFRKSPGFSTFFASVRPFFDDIEEMRHYEATPVRSDGN